jgi:hypothetical protein
MIQVRTRRTKTAPPPRPPLFFIYIYIYIFIFGTIKPLLNCKLLRATYIFVVRFLNLLMKVWILKFQVGWRVHGIPCLSCESIIYLFIYLSMHVLIDNIYIDPLYLMKFRGAQIEGQFWCKRKISCCTILCILMFIYRICYAMNFGWVLSFVR